MKATHGSDEVSASAPATVARSVKTPAALSATGALLARLHQVGAECELHGSRRQPTAGGVCITVEVLDALRSPMVTMRLANTLLLLLQDDIPVTLGLRGLGSPGKAERILRDFCTLLAGVLDDGGVVYAAPGLCVSAREIASQPLLDIAAALGAGPRYVSFDEGLVEQARTSARTIWHSLWRARQAAVAPWPVYGSEAHAVCGLLGDESATAVLPAQGLRVPTGSAWLPIRLDLMRYVQASGELNWEELHLALQVVVQAADLLLDNLSWPLAAQRNDAWLNRRLAIQLTGLGELVHTRGQRPRELQALRDLDRDVGKISKLLQQVSHCLALERGVLPALAAADPSVAWVDGPQRETWRQRWQQAVRHAAVRHRNLLVLSPYSLISEEGSDYRESADLLPILRHAQAIAFANPPQCEGDLDAFCTFHSRAAAILRAAQCARSVATMP